MPKCHICGKSGVYTEMIDNIVYSVHPECEHKLYAISDKIKEFLNCSICKNTNGISKEELRNHLIKSHTKESLADLIINSMKYIYLEY
jgi:hypothetical protein